MIINYGLQIPMNSLLSFNTKKLLSQIASLCCFQITLFSIQVNSVLSKEMGYDQNIAYKENVSYVSSIVVNVVDEKWQKDSLLSIDIKPSNFGYAVLYPSASGNEPEYFLTNMHVYNGALGRETTGESYSDDQPPITIFINQVANGVPLRCSLQARPSDVRAVSPELTDRGEDIIILTPIPGWDQNPGCRFKESGVVFSKVQFGDSRLLRKGDLVYGAGNVNPNAASRVDLRNFKLVKMKMTYVVSQDDIERPSPSFYEYSPVESEENLEKGSSGGAIVTPSSVLMGIHAGGFSGDSSGVRRMVPSAIICQTIIAKKCSSIPTEKPINLSNQLTDKDSLSGNPNSKKLTVPQLW